MTTVTAEASPAKGVVQELYFRTKILHAEAERSGTINDMLRGKATKDEYALLMRNLFPAYLELEQGLDRHRHSHGLSELASYQLDRASAIKSDLNELAGHGWADEIALLDAGKAYAARIRDAATGDGMKLIAHAYTRYLGDLSGGLILQKLLARAPGLKPNEMAFYGFSNFSDLALLKSDYRAALDRAASLAADRESIIEEGAAAFSLNIDLSWAVKRASPALAVHN